MNEEELLCYFAEPNFKGTYSCRGLNVIECSGRDAKCAFYKAKEKYNIDRDKAIDRCRFLGRCENCRYRDIPCRKSNEIKDDRIEGDKWI